MRKESGVVKKEYMKPEVQYVTLAAEDDLMNDDLIDGEMGTESSIF